MPVKQPVRRRGIVANLELAKPDEAAAVTSQHFGQKPIQPLSHTSIQFFRNPRFDPVLGVDQCGLP
jgi:hypothetical protein